MSSDVLRYLHDTPGTYALISWGDSKAVILNGSDEFLRRGENLFLNHAPSHNADGRAHRQAFARSLGGSYRMIPLSEERILGALTNYLYGRFHMARAQYEDVVDEEGDVVDWRVVVDEIACLADAQGAARAFYESMLPDYSCLQHAGSLDSEYAMGTAQQDDGIPTDSS